MALQWSERVPCPASQQWQQTHQTAPAIPLTPSPSPGQTDWCLLTDFSITRQSETAAEGSEGQNSQRLMIPHGVIR